MTMTMLNQLLGVGNNPEATGKYQKLSNLSWGPYFTIELPANWGVDELLLVDSKGKWIALRSPAGGDERHCIALDICVFERDGNPKYQSLDAFVDSAVCSPSLEKAEILWKRTATVAGLEGREIKLRSPNPGLRAADIEQYYFVVRGNYAFQVCYRSQEASFDAYFEAYQRARASLNFEQ